MRVSGRQRDRMLENIQANAHSPGSISLGVSGLLLCLCCGCSYLRSVTVKQTDPKTGIVTEKTTARAYTLFDSSAVLVKFRNTTGGDAGSNKWVSGTSIGSLNQESSSSNLVSIIGAVAEGVVKGLK